MKTAALLPCLALLAGSVCAQTPATPAAPAAAKQAVQPDADVKAALEALGINYKIDADGDFTVVYEEKDGRSQQVLVRSPVETYGSNRVREIWAIGYRVEGEQFPAAVANRMLEHSYVVKMGGWAKHGQHGVFIVKIDADASKEALRDAMEAASENADKIEKELTGGTDEF